MKKGFLIGILTAFALLVVVNVSAQERALGKDRKSLQKYEKVLNKDLKKKALKEARKEAKRLTKEGFRTPVGKLPLDKQIEDAWQKQAELDMEGNPYWYVASARVIAGNQSAAVLHAKNAGKICLVGQIWTQVT